MPLPNDYGSGIGNWSEILDSVSQEQALKDSIREMQKIADQERLALAEARERNILAASIPELENELYENIEDAVVSLDNFKESGEIDNWYDEWELLRDELGYSSIDRHSPIFMQHEGLDDLMLSRRYVRNQPKVAQAYEAYKEAAWRGSGPFGAMGYPILRLYGENPPSGSPGLIGGELGQKAYDNYDTQRNAALLKFFEKKERMEDLKELLDKNPKKRNQYLQLKMDTEKALRIYKQYDPESNIELEDVLKEAQEHSSLNELEELNDLYRTQASLDFVASSA